MKEQAAENAKLQEQIFSQSHRQRQRADLPSAILTTAAPVLEDETTLDCRAGGDGSSSRPGAAGAHTRLTATEAAEEQSELPSISDVELDRLSPVRRASSPSLSASVSVFAPSFSLTQQFMEPREPTVLLVTRAWVWHVLEGRRVGRSQRRVMRLVHRGPPRVRTAGHPEDLLTDVHLSNWPGRLYIAFSFSLCFAVFALCVVSTTDTGLNTNFRSGYTAFIAVAALWLSLEWLLRLWACVESSDYAGRRWRFVSMPLSLLDLLLLAPLYADIFLEWMDGPDSRSRGFGEVSLVRVLPMLLMLRLERYTHSFRFLLWVCREHRAELVVYAFVGSVLLLTLSVFVFLAEHNKQPHIFPSIASCFWFSSSVLTLTGDGNMLPKTSFGRILAGTFAFTSVGFFGLPGTDSVVLFRLLSSVDLLSVLFSAVVFGTSESGGERAYTSARHC